MATPLTFQRATKAQARARIALIGVSGSGKTFTALTFAGVLGQRIALIDTEHGSASKYADEFAFDVLELSDFAPQAYVEAIEAAGAGLMVPCADCGRQVQVPIPDASTPAAPVAAPRPFNGAEDPQVLIEQLDAALAMAMGHVILKENFVDKKVEYFDDYVKQYTDLGMLITLVDHPEGHGLVPGKFLTAADLPATATVSDAAFKTVVWDDATSGPAVPNGLCLIHISAPTRLLSIS